MQEAQPHIQVAGSSMYYLHDLLDPILSSRRLGHNLSDRFKVVSIIE
jgi:hypothetical protein